MKSVMRGARSSQSDKNDVQPILQEGRRRMNPPGSSVAKLSFSGGESDSHATTWKAQRMSNSLTVDRPGLRPAVLMTPPQVWRPATREDGISLKSDVPSAIPVSRLGFNEGRRGSAAATLSQGEITTPSTFPRPT